MLPIDEKKQMPYVCLCGEKELKTEEE